jgi:hypothetical protein
MKLFLITRNSELIVEEIIKSSVSGEQALVVTPSMSIAQSLTQYNGIQGYIIPGESLSQGEHDSRFYKKYMPGILDSIKLQGTNLSTHEFMGIDRLRFWCSWNSDLKEFLDSLSIDEIIYSLDFYSPLYLPSDVKKKTAVKTHDLISPIAKDILPRLDATKLIVSTDFETNIIKTWTKRYEVESRGINKSRPKTSQSMVDSFQGIFGSKDNLFVFDKQYEWIAREIIGDRS